MTYLKRYKQKFIGLVLLIYLVWFFVNYTAHVSSSVKLPTTTRGSLTLRQREDMTTESKDNLKASNVPILLKDINKTLIKFIRNVHASKIAEYPVPATRQPTRQPTRKPTAKPFIDIVNDYYPFVDFKFVFPEISPKIEKATDIFMIVLVNSGARGDEFRKRREVIRQTWGDRSNCEQRKALQDERLKDLRWLLVFVVGKAGPGTNDDELNMAEARQHNDMLIGNITDNYINNIIKFYMGQVWAKRFDIKYTLKTDDDVYVRIPRVVEYLVNAQLPRQFYGGRTYPSIRVNRVIGGKWTVSWKYFGEVNFPVFNPGAFFILSSDLLNRLFNYVYIRKPFHTDDAYVGVAMRDFGVKVTTVASFLVRGDMGEFIHKAKDCEMSHVDAFAHGMDPESIGFLHNRIVTLACGSLRLKC